MEIYHKMMFRLFIWHFWDIYVFLSPIRRQVGVFDVYTRLELADGRTKKIWYYQSAKYSEIIIHFIKCAGTLVVLFLYGF